jgi:hypothetical protein
MSLGFKFETKHYNDAFEDYSNRFLFCNQAFKGQFYQIFNHCYEKIKQFQNHTFYFGYWSNN